MGSLVWVSFLGAFPPGWESSNSCKVDLNLRWMPMLSRMEVTPRSLE